MSGKNFVVPGLTGDDNVIFGKIAVHVAWIFAAGMHIGEEQVHLVLQLAIADIFRVAGMRIRFNACQHTANL
ncbi:hypothetical protein D3C75_807780 [compost metagenome]